MKYPELTEGVIGCACENLMDYSEDCAKADLSEALRILIENSDSDVCKLLWTLIAEGRTLYDFVLGIYAPTKPVCASRMYFTVNFAELDSAYDGSLEGETVYVMLCVEGELVCVQVAVEGGEIRFALDRLGMEKPDYSFTQFIVVDEVTFTELYGEGAIPEGCLIGSDGRAVDFEAGETAEL